MSQPFSLSAKGLTHIPTQNYRIMQFTFTVAGISYITTNLMADFLSLKLARLHAATPLLESFALDASDPQRCFAHFLSLARGESVEISDSNADYYLSFATILENPELFQFLSAARPQELTLSNAVDRLSLLRRMELSHAEEIQFVADHFFEFPHTDIGRLEPSLLSEVIGASGPRDPEGLFALISAATQSDPRYFDLFQFVPFERLSLQSMSRFIGLADSLAPSVSLGSAVWRSLCRRLLCDGTAPAAPAPPSGAQSVTEFDPSRPLFGIISYLSQKYGGNVHKNGIVRVTSSSSYSVRVPENIVALDQKSYFYSNNGHNEWIAYEFVTVVVTPTVYSLQTRLYGGGCHIQSWALEGSGDGLNWIELDRQTDVADLNDLGRIKSFPVSCRVQCKFIRLRQTGPNSSGNNHLCLSRLELFGELYE
jgi:hypothetical protein